MVVPHSAWSGERLTSLSSPWKASSILFSWGLARSRVSTAPSE